MNDLDAALLQAHEIGDKNELVKLYTQAANQQEELGETESTCFFLTQAFIFALETGHCTTERLNQRLVNYGREEPLNG